MTDNATTPWWNDDDALLAALEQALNPSEAVPEHITRTALACYTWRQIDAELATLTYDSTADEREPTRTRSETAILRTLTFEATDVTFELEIRPDGVAGQLITTEARELELQLSNGETAAVNLTEHGYFKISPTPRRPFRLRCRLADNRTISTVLITL